MPACIHTLTPMDVLFQLGVRYLTVRHQSTDLTVSRSVALRPELKVALPWIQEVWCEPDLSDAGLFDGVCSAVDVCSVGQGVQPRPSGRHADVCSCVYPAPHGCSQHKQVLTDFSGLQDIIQQAADTSWCQSLQQQETNVGIKQQQMDSNKRESRRKYSVFCRWVWSEFINVHKVNKVKKNEILTLFKQESVT